MKSFRVKPSDEKTWIFQVKHSFCAGSQAAEKILQKKPCNVLKNSVFTPHEDRKDKKTFAVDGFYLFFLCFVFSW